MIVTKKQIWILMYEIFNMKVFILKIHKNESGKFDRSEHWMNFIGL